VEYLRAGAPILVHAPADSNVARLARAHDLGLVVDENDVAALAAAIRRFLENPAAAARYTANAQAFFEREHDEPVGAGRLAAVIDPPLSPP
jgi:glycosyltransferase involved in cell wall biosynthesis